MVVAMWGVMWYLSADLRIRRPRNSSGKAFLIQDTHVTRTYSHLADLCSHCPPAVGFSEHMQVPSCCCMMLAVE